MYDSKVFMLEINTSYLMRNMYIAYVKIQLPKNIIQNYNINVIKSESKLTTSRKKNIDYSKIVMPTILYIMYRMSQKHSSNCLIT